MRLFVSGGTNLLSRCDFQHAVPVKCLSLNTRIVANLQLAKQETNDCISGGLSHSRRPRVKPLHAQLHVTVSDFT